MSNEEKATAFVLGSLSNAERDEVMRERLYNRELDEHIALAERLYAGLQPTQTACAHSGDFARIADALAREVDALGGKHVEECADGAWQTHNSKIEFKSLWAATAVLIRCNPGALEEAHSQPDDLDEHILVVAGDLDIAGRRFATGDYIRIPAGTRHPHMQTHGGCLLFTNYLSPDGAARDFKPLGADQRAFGR
ncbi:MAG: cupin domain-containing protein [Sphingomonadaceae bacterium]|nr:cupin domain-containing protein [Sphingomonadaceae bacterium]